MIKIQTLYYWSNLLFVEGKVKLAFYLTYNSKNTKNIILKVKF